MIRAVVSVVKVDGSRDKFAVLRECGHGEIWHLERDADQSPPKFLRCLECS